MLTKTARITLLFIHSEISTFKQQDTYLASSELFTSKSIMSRGKGTSGFSPVSIIGILAFLISFSTNPKMTESKHSCIAYAWNCQYLRGGRGSFILRKILLHKRSRTCKSFFLYIPHPPTPQSLKHSYPKEGYHSTTVLISSSGLQTSPICFSSATPVTAAPEYDGLITSTAGRAELRKSQFNRLFDN